MRKVWLASYPKSGNTWMRMLIAAMSLKEGEALNINDLRESHGIASAREAFNSHTLIDSGLLTHDEVDALRPAVHAAQLLDGDETAASYFVKVHDAYTYLADGEPLLGGPRGADGAVLIVRDPRAVAPSFANHNGSDIDTAIARMTDRDNCSCDGTRRTYGQLRQRLLGWSGFNASWLDQRDIPVLVVRYEDMLADTSTTLKRVADFAGLHATADQIDRAVAMTDFDALVKQEGDKGFREAPHRTTAGRFFRRGQSDAWRDELTREQIARLEAAHAAMMWRLGYPTYSHLAGAKSLGCNVEAIGGESR